MTIRRRMYLQPPRAVNKEEMREMGRSEEKFGVNLSIQSHFTHQIMGKLIIYNVCQTYA